MPKFILPGAPEGTKILNDRYEFVDGVLEASAADAPLLERVLCRFYGCELVQDPVSESTGEAAQSGSLAVDATKPDAAAKTVKAKAGA